MPTIQFISLNCFGKQETNHTECDLTRPSGSFLALRLVCVPCLLSLSRAVIGEPLGGCARVVHTTITTVLPSGAPPNYPVPLCLDLRKALLIFFACPPLPQYALRAAGERPHPLASFSISGGCREGGSACVPRRGTSGLCSVQRSHTPPPAAYVFYRVACRIVAVTALRLAHSSRCSIAAVTHTQPQPLPPPAPLSLTHTVACAQLKLDDTA
jgi:hypothetical protein